MSHEFPGRLAGGASAMLAITALAYAGLGEIDLAGEVARWSGVAGGSTGPDATLST